MSKFKKLQFVYAKEIAGVKEATRLAAEAMEEMNSLDTSGMTDFDSLCAGKDSTNKWIALDQERAILLSRLTEHIQNEYSAVPFGDTATKGVAAFFREAGL